MGDASWLGVLGLVVVYVGVCGGGGGVGDRRMVGGGMRGGGEWQGIEEQFTAGKTAKTTI